MFISFWASSNREGCASRRKKVNEDRFFLYPLTHLVFWFKVFRSWYRFLIVCFLIVLLWKCNCVDLLPLVTLSNHPYEYITESHHVWFVSILKEKISNHTAWLQFRKSSHVVKIFTESVGSCLSTSLPLYCYWSDMVSMYSE